METLPIRIQRRRTAGFSLSAQSPDGRPVAAVTRPWKWGNPFRVVAAGIQWRVQQEDGSRAPALYSTVREASAHAVELYEKYVAQQVAAGILNPQELRGKHLACYCEVTMPCHADVLLKWANAAPEAADESAGAFVAARTLEEMQALRDEVRRKACVGVGVAALRVARRYYRLDELLAQGDELQARLQATEAAYWQLADESSRHRAAADVALAQRMSAEDALARELADHALVDQRARSATTNAVEAADQVEGLEAALALERQRAAAALVYTPSHVALPEYAKLVLLHPSRKGAAPGLGCRQAEALSDYWQVNGQRSIQYAMENYDGWCYLPTRVAC